MADMKRFPPGMVLCTQFGPSPRVARSQLCNRGRWLVWQSIFFRDSGGLARVAMEFKVMCLCAMYTTAEFMLFACCLAARQCFDACFGLVVPDPTDRLA